MNILQNILQRLREERRQDRLRKSLLDAAERGDTGVVLALLDGGLGVDEDDCGATALFMAAKEGHSETVEALLRRGASPDARDCEHEVTVLMLAAASGDVPTVRALLGAGPEVNVWEWMGRSALDYAANEEVAAVLRQAGAEHGPEEAEALGEDKG